MADNEKNNGIPAEAPETGGPQTQEPAAPETQEGAAPREGVPQTEPQPSARDRVRGRLRESNPDKYGAEGYFDSEDNEFGAIDDELRQNGETINRFRESERKLRELLNGDEMSGELFIAMAGGENPVAWFFRKFGPKMKDYLETPDGAELFTKLMEELAKKQEEEGKAMKQREATLQESFGRLYDFRKEKNLTDEQTQAVFGKLWDMGMKAIDGDYDTADFELAYKALNYDADVETARRTGEVEGRNQKIVEKMRRSEPQAKMPTSMEGGAVDTSQEGRPKPESLKEEFAKDPLGLRRLLKKS